MRILMLSDVFFPRINGVSTSIKTFRDDLVNRGHHVDILAPAYPNTQTTPHEPGLIRVPSHYLFFDPEDRLMSLRSLRQQIPALSKQAYDILHIHTPFSAHYIGVRIARVLGKPLTATYHTHFEAYFSHYLPRLPPRALQASARWLTRRQCRQVDTVVVPSLPMQQTLLEYGVTTPITVLPTGIRPEQFHHGDGQRFRQQHGIAQNRPILLHVGRVAHEKNIGLLLDMLPWVLKEVPNALLLIVGAGPARRALEQRCIQQGLLDHVNFVGYLNRESELPDCYHAGDVFVFSSRTETQGLVLLEAMAAGFPVVALPILGVQDIMSAGRGGLCADENPREFAQQVLRLLQEPKLHGHLAADARHYASTWSGDVMAGRLENHYADLLSLPTH